MSLEPSKSHSFSGTSPYVAPNSCHFHCEAFRTSRPVFVRLSMRLATCPMSVCSISCAMIAADLVLRAHVGDNSAPDDDVPARQREPALDAGCGS
jgi:hypothetical protein